MLGIQLRLKNNLTCIISGETGCGKSSLIREMCAIISMPLRVLNIHGGTTENDVVEFIEEKIHEVKMVTNSTTPQLLIFLDEINTSNILGLAKELAEGYMNGKRIESCVRVIMACNPYRLKKKRTKKKVIIKKKLYRRKKTHISS